MVGFPADSMTSAARVDVVGEYVLNSVRASSAQCGPALRVDGLAEIVSDAERRRRTERRVPVAP